MQFQTYRKSCKNIVKLNFSIKVNSIGMILIKQIKNIFKFSKQLKV